MSSSLLRNPHTCLTVSCRQWFLHRCIHLSTQAYSTSKVTALTDCKTEKESPRSRTSTRRKKDVAEPPSQNLISLHLEKIRENPLTVEDIETQRPFEIPNSLSPDYEQKYRSVIESLDKAFTVKQMHDFLETNNIPLPRRKTKIGLAAQILEQKWGWEALEGVVQRKVDWSKVVEEQFPLDKVEAFLLMGKDGTGARQLSKRYESQVNFIPDPMSVKVTGLKGSVKKFALYLERFKEDIEVEHFTFPSDENITVETSTISRLSGAYVKITNDYEVSISFLRSFPRAADVAKRLILQTAAEGIDQCTRAIIHLPKQVEVFGTTECSLFPFSPETSVPSPKASTTTFRYRQVGQNFMKAAVPIPSEDQEDIRTFGSALTADNIQCDIKNWLLSQMPVNQTFDSSLSFIASSGQFLFISSPEQQSLLPPITGPVNPDAIFNWIDDKPSQVMFRPSAPSEIVSAPAHQVHNTRRLTYRTFTSGQKLDSTYVANRSNFQRTVELEIPIPDTASDNFTTSGLLDSATCVKYMEKHLDLLIPNRQNTQSDIRISALQTQTLSFDAWPEELQNVELHPTTESENVEDNIPLMFKLDNETYILHRDEHIQHSFKTIAQQGPERNHHIVMVETSIDDATGGKETSCKTMCQDYITTAGWNDFLKSWGCLARPRFQKTAPDPSVPKPSSFF